MDALSFLVFVISTLIFSLLFCAVVIRWNSTGTTLLHNKMHSSFHFLVIIITCCFHCALVIIVPCGSAQCCVHITEEEGEYKEGCLCNRRGLLTLYLFYILRALFSYQNLTAFPPCCFFLCTKNKRGGVPLAGFSIYCVATIN